MFFLWEGLTKTSPFTVACHGFESMHPRAQLVDLFAGVGSAFSGRIGRAPPIFIYFAKRNPFSRCAREPKGKKPFWASPFPNVQPFAMLIRVCVQWSPTWLTRASTCGTNALPLQARLKVTCFSRGHAQIVSPNFCGPK